MDIQSLEKYICGGLLVQKSNGSVATGDITNIIKGFCIVIELDNYFLDGVSYGHFSFAIDPDCIQQEHPSSEGYMILTQDGDIVTFHHKMADTSDALTTRFFL